MKTIFIQDPRELDAQYERLLPIFKRVPSVDEYRPEQLFELAKKGGATIGYCERDDGQAVIAFAFEFIFYPNMTAANIIALAGEDFEAVAADLLQKFRAFAKLAGADYVEALCHDSMARMLTKYGFKKANIQMRVEV
jgi:hypothetical protein